ncbi:hypothetical protein [Desulfopila sp. IMCC35008]|uniref:hypothetical protein n=1 Tax=Desulfopila sp. IMCC35008 TaxID=2653858 RepID=UPI0013D41334|nr:hypothetical protein [Desulfopila sp. IMCC35008]
MIFCEKSSYDDSAAGSIGGVKGAKQSGAFILTLDSTNAGGYFPHESGESVTGLEFFDRENGDG